MNHIVIRDDNVYLKLTKYGNMEIVVSIDEATTLSYYDAWKLVGTMNEREQVKFSSLFKPAMRWRIVVKK